MNLTIEKASKHKCPAPALCCASAGFIEGWNSCIEKIIDEVLKSSANLSVDRKKDRHDSEMHRLKDNGYIFRQ